MISFLLSYNFIRLCMLLFRINDLSGCISYTYLTLKLIPSSPLTQLWIWVSESSLVSPFISLQWTEWYAEVKATWVCLESFIRTSLIWICSFSPKPMLSSKLWMSQTLYGAIDTHMWNTWYTSVFVQPLKCRPRPLSFGSKVLRAYWSQG